MRHLPLFLSLLAASRLMAADPLVIPGGEACKNDFRLIEQCWRAINEAGAWMKIKIGAAA